MSWDSLNDNSLDLTLKFEMCSLKKKIDQKFE